MSDCKNYVSEEDIKALKESELHIEHVARSRNLAGEKVLSVTDTIRGEKVTNRTLDGLEELFNDLLSKSGVKQLGDYKQGLIIDGRNQIVFENGLWYSYRGELPHTTTGATLSDDGGIWSDDNPEGLWVAINLSSDRTDQITGSTSFPNFGFIKIGDVVPRNTNSLVTVKDVIYSFNNNFNEFEHVISGIDYNSNNYIVHTDKGSFEFLNYKFKRLRDDFLLDGWYSDKKSPSLLADIKKAFDYYLSISEGSFTNVIRNIEPFELSDKLEIPSFIRCDLKCTVTSDNSQIYIFPNSKSNWNIRIPGNVNPELFYFDGKIETPRWYVGDHDTSVTGNVHAEEINGTLVVFDAVSDSKTRSLISGVDFSMMLYRMHTAVVERVNSVNNPGKAYITNNRIKIIASGTRRMLAQSYSSSNKPSNEEIGGNIYDLEHQPSIDTEYKLIKMVGRMNRVSCNLWDTEHATNDDVIVITGNDNIFTGPNLPSSRSKYVQITGLRNTYIGNTYGVPEFSTNVINAERGFSFGSKRDFKVDGVILISESKPSLSKSSPTRLFTKNITIDEFRRPYYLNIKSISDISSGTIKCSLTIGDVTFNHSHNVVGKVIQDVEILIKEAEVIIFSNVNGNITYNIFNNDIKGLTNLHLDVSGVDGVNFYNVLRGGTDNI